MLPHLNIAKILMSTNDKRSFKHRVNKYSVPLVTTENRVNREGCTAGEEHVFEQDELKDGKQSDVTLNSSHEIQSLCPLILKVKCNKCTV